MQCACYCKMVEVTSTEGKVMVGSGDIYVWIIFKLKENDPELKGIGH